MIKIICPACGEYVDRIDREHAIQHGHATLAGFMRENGIDYKTMAQRSRTKIQELYNIDATRWNPVYLTAGGDWRYTAKTYYKDGYEEAKAEGVRSATKFPLGNGEYNRHFNGRDALAIFAYGTHARYFGFDVDTKEEAPTHTLQIVKALMAEGIARNDIHVSFSGGKGYHIEVFIDGHIKFEDWALFADYIKDKAGLLGNGAIEYRPTSTNGHAWKLPLTYHSKTGAFAGYCDNETLARYSEQDSHDYLYAIQPMKTDAVTTILRRARSAAADITRREEELKRKAAEEAKEKRTAVNIVDNRVFQSEEEKEQTAMDRLRYGLVEAGTRHDVTITIAQYLHFVSGNTIEDTREMLIRWTEAQDERGLVENTREDYIKDIDGILSWVETNDGFYARKRELQITRGEFDWLSIETDRSTRDFLFALILFSKAYAKPDGTFYVGRRKLETMLKMSSHTIEKCRKSLEADGFIVAQVPTKKEAFVDRKAITYRLLYEPTAEVDIIDTIEFTDETDCRELLRSIAGKLYTPKQLRQLRFTVRKNKTA